MGEIFFYFFKSAHTAPAIAQNIGENPILLQPTRNISTPLRYARKNIFVRLPFLNFLNPINSTGIKTQSIAISDGIPLVAAV